MNSTFISCFYFSSSCLWNRWFNGKTTHSAGNLCGWLLELGFRGTAAVTAMPWKGEFPPFFIQLFLSLNAIEGLNSRECLFRIAIRVVAASALGPLPPFHVVQLKSMMHEPFRGKYVVMLPSAIDIFMKNIYRLNGHDILRDSNEDWSLALAGCCCFDWIIHLHSQNWISISNFFLYPATVSSASFPILRLSFFQPQSQHSPSLARSGSKASIAIRVHHLILNSRSMNK